MEDIKQLAYNILSGEFVDSEGLLDNILMSKINDRLEDMKTDVMESQAIDEEGEIDEGIDVKFDRHINAHGKKPNQSAHAMWMFTHKRSGDVDYNKESEVHQTSGKFGEAKKSAKAWAKKHGHSEVYVMEQTNFEIDEEALDELSKKTLSSYTTKAFDDMDKQADNIARMPNSSQRSDYQKDLAKRSGKKFDKRGRGLATAVRKLTKENAEAMGLELSEEELDELSKKTLGSYINKASHSLGINAMNMGAGPNKALHPKDRDADYKKSRNTVTKRLKGLQNAAKQVTKENAELMGLELSEEELDELSKKTLGSYINKASRSLRNAEHSDMKTFQKRDKGIKKAVDKYTQK